MPEVRFYHLTETPLEAALPVMLERTLERGMRAVVRGTSAERLAFLNDLLWTADEASFLPHGMEGDGDPDRQPVWLTTGMAVPNGAETLFLIDGARASDAEFSGLSITALLFDGHDPAAVEAARGEWRRAAGAGLTAVYWAQEPGARWVKKTETRPAG